jgi:glyoxylase-like metal-dependent hydrolase (beta-lactamase superfamily II)
MTQRRIASSLVLALSLAAPVAAAERPTAQASPQLPAEHLPSPAAASVSSAPVPGLDYRLEKVAEGVYCAIASGVPYYISNAVVIVGDDSVAVVDPGAGPNEARVLRAAISAVTDLPVRYVIDTHFHFDHAFGSEAFKGAVVIGHEATRALLGPDAIRGRTVASFIAEIPTQARKARDEATKETDPQKSGELLRRAVALETYQNELAALRPLPPSLTFGESLSLWLGSREIRLLYFGRGHTSGDIVVFLPRQRIACTGDLFNGYIGYLGDAYVDEWAETLGRLAKLDFETAIPGHGEPFSSKEAIAPVQACLRDLWRQVENMKRKGVSPEAAAPRVDLRAHASRFPRFTEIGFELPAVRRMYEVIDERSAKSAATRR